MKYLYFSFILLFSGIILSTTTVNAQNFEGLGAQSNAVSIKTSPKYPGPNQQVSVTIESFSTDLTRADISWILNGSQESGGIGQTNFQFKTEGYGSVSNILIVIKAKDGSVIQQSLNIHPATVDIVWEAQSYTPPFYKGKALYPFQGTVKMVAVPNIVTENGGLINAKNLVYNWKIDGNPNPDTSGYGKNFMLFTGGIPLKPTNIKVEVSSLDQAYSAEGNVSISPIQPQILFYEDSPILGTLYDKILSGNVKLQNEEIKIIAVPYFMGVTDKESNTVDYKWQMNNRNINPVGKKSSLTFRKEQGASGTASVFLETSNTLKIFQSSNASLNLFF